MPVGVERSADGGLAVRVRVPSKINLHLGVGALRPDGYHDLTTVYHAIGLYDEVTATGAEPGAGRRDGSGDGGPAVTVDGEGAGELPLDGGNLAVRAVRALAAATGRDPRVRLHLRKRIPVAGGLAGGSADAAAALVACDTLWGTGLTRAELGELAAGLGSDVPFLLYGGTATGTGRGERIAPLPAGPAPWHWVVAVADGGLSTPAVYAELDRLRSAGLAAPPPTAGVPGGLVSALAGDDPAALAAALHNDLEPAALSLRPALRATLDAGRAAGALAGIVSGSGPTCVFLAADAGAARDVAAALTASGAGGAVCRRAYPVTGPVARAEVY